VKTRGVKPDGDRSLMICLLIISLIVLTLFNAQILKLNAPVFDHLLCNVLHLAWRL